MKSLLLLSFLSFSILGLGQELATVAQPDLKSPLPAEWSIAKGSWEAKDGELVASELPAQKHSAVLWHKVPMQTGSVDCEFRLDGSKVFILGCDGDKHIGRVTILPTIMRIQDDSTEVKGKKPSTTLAEAKLDLKQGQWYKLHYEWNGNRMAATLDGKQIEGSNDNLGKKKVRWWFAVGGQKATIRNIKVSGIKS